MATEDHPGYNTGHSPAGPLDLEGWVMAQHPDHQAEARALAASLTALINGYPMAPEDLRELLLSLADHLQE